MLDWILYNGHMCKKTKFKGYYVSEYGEVITVKVKGGQGSLDYNNPREHNYKIDKDGYLEVCLSTINEYGKHVRIYRRVHRLVWETFFGDIPLDLTIDHIDNNKQNNCLSNLRLLTRSTNARIAHINKPSKKKYMYALFQNNTFCGVFSRNDLCTIFNIPKNTHIWYNDKYINYFKNIGFDIEFIGSVEDIERIIYY